MCGASKDIGSYNLHPCRHNCLFCYANPACDSSGDTPILKKP
jgi:DNA repair photolyase